MTTPQKEQIFISYSRRDDDVMQRVVKFLRNEGLNAWVDNENLVPGTPVWERELERAIKHSGSVIVLLSPDSKESEWVTRELVVAQRHKKRIFPILVRGDEDSSLHFRLSTHQYIDFRSSEKRGLRELYKAIVDYYALLQSTEEHKEKLAREAAEKAERERIAREKRETEEREKEERRKKESAEKAAFAKERREQSIENLKKFFAQKGKFLLFGVGGIALLLLLGYGISNIDFSPAAETTSTEVTSTSSALSVAPTSVLSDATPTAEALSVAPTSALGVSETPTDVPVSPTPELGVGSTMVSEKDGMTLVYVPAGEFQMGTDDGQEDEMPVHTVYLDSYWIDQTEVTNAMFAKCVLANACDEPSNIASDTRDNYYGNVEFGNYPVIYISWSVANNYCNWAGRRLPSEAEWEKAASWDADAQSQRLYPWGDTRSAVYANYNGSVGDTTAVGSYESGKSFYGAYDMAGNVWEWVNDWHASDYYVNSPEANPLGPETGTNRVLRGGSWYYHGSLIRSTMRFELPASTMIYDSGFRCAFSP